MADNIYSVISMIIVTINIIFIVVAVFFERKKPVQALSWVLTLLLLPLLGFILYLVFGRTLRFRKKKFYVKCDISKKYCQEICKVLDYAYYDEAEFNEPYSDEVKQLIKLNINSSQSPYTNDNEVEIFTSAEEKYRKLLHDIEAARSSIHILYFIFQNDNIGKRVINALAQKAKEGLEVRLLFDHGSNLIFPFNAFNPIADNGGEVLSFFSSTLGNYSRANFRNHRKIVVIDGEIGYLGGINIGDEYLGMRKKVSPWRDTHLRITGSSVYSLQLRFMTDWLYASRKNVEFKDTEKYFMPISKQNTGSTGMQLVSSGPDTNGEEIKRGLIKMINSAKKFIYIQTPYFVPDSTFLEALQNAAMSGVEVVIQIPAVPDKRFVYKATMSFVADVIKYGIKIYLYPGFLHAKMLVADDSCAIGTANIDIRSFALNFEIQAFMYGKEISNRCTEIFKDDLKASKQLTRDIYNKRSIFSKVEENIIRLLSPIL